MVRRSYATTCRKIRYPDRFEAHSALLQVQRKRRCDPSRKESDVYLCPYCKGYHLTSQPQRP